MRWPCKSCALVGREPFKSMSEFGVHSPEDFAQHLLPQGVWTRCSQCKSAAPEVRAKGPAQANESNGNDMAMAVAIAPCIANVSVHQCATCRNEKGKVDYWEQDWARRKDAISCKACQPKMPSERSTGQGHLSEALIELNAARHGRTSVCVGCDKALHRDGFWPYDIERKKESCSA